MIAMTSDCNSRLLRYSAKTLLVGMTTHPLGVGSRASPPAFPALANRLWFASFSVLVCADCIINFIQYR